MLHLGYHRNLLYVASESELRIMQVEDELESGGEELIINPRSNFQRIKIPEGVKLKALLLRIVAEQSLEHFYCVFETLDNQLDFNVLTVSDYPGADPESDYLNYEFKQLRPLKPRDVRDDPIVKFATAFTSAGPNHSAALRKSG